jgi:hypothetical protein
MSVHPPRNRPQSPPPPHARPDDPSGAPGPTEPVDLRDLFPLSEIHRHLPRRPDGKKLHRTSVGRWASRGCRGVILRTWLVGGVRFTSSRAVADFVACLTAPRRGERPDAPRSPAIVDIVATKTAKTNSASPRRDRIESDLKRFGL